MRFNTPVEYKTIDEALVKGGCPFCTYLKYYQSSLLIDINPREVSGLCKFHVWAMAAAANKTVVSSVFRSLIKASRVQVTTECSLCKAVAVEEDSRMKEFAGDMARVRILDWISVHGTFCIPHGTKFIDYLPENLKTVITTVLQRSATDLEGALASLDYVRSTEKAAGGGILGRAAEFLASQRGL